MNRPHPYRMWEVFFRIGESASFNVANATFTEKQLGDVAREAALCALARVKGDVLPLVRKMQAAGFIDWYSFLIHDREGGVPTTDNGAYVHLRVSLTEAGAVLDPIRWTDAAWEMISCMEVKSSEVEDWWLIGEQSALVLAVIERHVHLDGQLLLEQLGQAIHHLSNMTQIPFPRPSWMAL